jgi:cell fate regulator YaaT (PSP1 superfamily)
MTEYLLTYGKQREFARFRTADMRSCRRGERFVIESPRGLEIGTVLRKLEQDPYQLLEEAFVGRIVRALTDADEAAARVSRERADHLFQFSRQAVSELHLPLDIVDAEVLLEGRGILHLLRWAECNSRSLLDRLGDEFRFSIRLNDLAATQSDELPTCGSGCGSGGCGECGHGGCSTCSVSRHGAINPPHVPASEGARISLA